MKIAFWSNAHGKNGVTSNLACISVMEILEKQRRNLLLENHFNINNLETVLNQSMTRNRLNEYNFYNQKGIEHLIRKIHSGFSLENGASLANAVSNSVMTFMEDRMSYLPQNYLMNQEVFDYEFNQVINPMFQLLEQFCDTVYIDTAVGSTLSSKIILEEADLIVVNLSQNPYVLEDFFEHYQSLMEKSVYLLGSYTPESKYTRRYIIRKYDIPRDKIAAIPYNVQFKDAVTSGNLISFLNKNYECGRKNENYYFIREVKKAIAMIESHRKPEEVTV